MADFSQTQEIISLMTVGILVMLTLALAFVLYFSRSTKTILQQQMDAQQKELEHQESLLFKTISTQEEERKRIAKELHDEVGSKLNVILLNLHRLQKSTGDVATAMPILTEVKAIINETIGTTRRISYDLLPPTLENFGLLEAIKELCDHYQKTGVVEVLLEIFQQDALNIAPEVSLNIYRVLQELFNNTIKYAAAQQIGLKIWFGQNHLKVEYRDNGKGFDLEKVQHQKGMGRKNMESRMKMIGGRLHYYSAIGNGVVAVLEVPAEIGVEE